MTLDEEFKRAAGIPPLRLADLIMMEWRGKLGAVLPHLQGWVDINGINKEIERVRAQMVDLSIFDKMARKIAKQQFGDRAAALRELTQNAIDAYELSDAERKIYFLVTREGGHTVLTARDYGKGMTLPEMVRFLLIPFNTTKEGDPNKIGEHGVGSFSFIDISDAVKYRSRRRGTEVNAQVIICERDHKLEALVSADEESMEAGTEVTLYIPTSIGLDRDTISRQLHKYVGYVEPDEAEIFLDDKRVNTLAPEYQHSRGEAVTIAGNTAPLVFSFSKRGLLGSFKDERFSERDMNLQNVVYTQAGFHIAYAPNPFAEGTMHFEFFKDLTALGLDFWVQVPNNAGLTISRNQFLPDHQPDILDAEYAAFQNLFLDAIIMDDLITYGDSPALRQTIGRVVSRGYMDVARKRMVAQQSRKKRVLSRVLPIAVRVGRALNAAARFVFTAPLKLAYYGVAIPIAAVIVGSARVIWRAGYKGVSKALATVLLLGALALGVGMIYQRGYERQMETAQRQLLVGLAPKSPRELRDPLSHLPRLGLAGELVQTQAQAANPGKSAKSNMKSAPLPPYSLPTSRAPDLVGRKSPPSAQGVFKERLSQDARAVTAPTPQPRFENPLPPPKSAVSDPPLYRGQGLDHPAGRWILNALLDTTSSVLRAAGMVVLRGWDRGRTLLRSAQAALELRLPLPEQYCSAVAASIVWTVAILGSLLGLLWTGYMICKVLRVAGIDPAHAARIAGKILLAPLYPLFLAGKGLRAAGGEALGLWEHNVGLYADMEERRQRKIEAHRARVIAKYVSQFQTEGFQRDLCQKKFIQAVLCTAAPSQGGLLFGFNAGHGEQVRISIYELIDLYVLRRIRRRGVDFHISKGDYLLDAGLPGISDILNKLEQIRQEVNDRYSPTLIEQQWEQVKISIAAIARLTYLLSGLGLLHILVSLCYPSIPNPYRESPIYEEVAKLMARSPMAMELAARSLKGIAQLPVILIVALAYGSYFACKAILYHLPILMWRGASWGGRKIIWPLITSPLLLPGVWLDFVEWQSARRIRKTNERLARERAREERLLREEEGRRREAERRKKEREAEQARRDEQRRRIQTRGGRLRIIGGKLVAARRAFGRGLYWLWTGYRENVIGTYRVDGETLHRIVTHAAVGRHYLQLFHAVQAMDALLSESLGLQPLRISYSYPAKGSYMLGELKSSKKPTLWLSMNDAVLQTILRDCDANPSRVCYTLLEALLYHKAMRLRTPKNKYKHHHEIKEELRTALYHRLGGSGAALESCVLQALASAPHVGISYVPAEEMARLASFRIRGLIKERDRLREKYLQN